MNRPVLWSSPSAEACRLSYSHGNNWAGAVNDRGQIVGQIGPLGVQWTRGHRS